MQQCREKVINFNERDFFLVKHQKTLVIKLLNEDENQFEEGKRVLITIMCKIFRGGGDEREEKMKFEFKINKIRSFAFSCLCKRRLVRRKYA